MTRGRKKEDISVIYDRWVKGKEGAVKAACRNGATNLDISNLLGCGRTTIQSLIKNHPKFGDMVRESKKISDLFVENALYQRACGYDFEETTTEVIVGKDGATATTFVKKTKKHIPPETAAAMAWLKNRRPKDWKDKHEVTVTDPWTELMKATDSEEDGD